MTVEELRTRFYSRLQSAFWKEDKLQRLWVDWATDRIENDGWDGYTGAWNKAQLTETLMWFQTVEKKFGNDGQLGWIREALSI